MAYDISKFQTEFNVSRETLNLLEVYEALLVKWNDKINLISKSTVPLVWERHFFDSAQLWPMIPASALSWLDFGSGAGFPALVNAVIAKEKRPDLNFTLVEADQRKGVFLSTIIRELGLNVVVVADRIEKIEPRKVDIITARAVASLDKLLGFSAPHAHKSTVLLFPKGRGYESELTAAQNHWHIEEKVFHSMTDSSSVILRIEDFNRVK
ncbi:MAG: 16S rRNA (guanine(527)-N(7))-methyltransferase RsmG [Rhodobacteraceae bacterium]|nr:16S rRNA (guanine(527)-N(7))-methyltransferase RsmG [Paracoccaceae bacterium]